MSIHSTGLGDDEPLVVRPKVACRLLDVGVTRLYELIDARELESYRDGAARKITVRSIKAYVARQLERPEPPTPDHHPARRRQAEALLAAIAEQAVGDVLDEVPGKAPVARRSRRRARAEERAHPAVG